MPSGLMLGLLLAVFMGCTGKDSPREGGRPDIDTVLQRHADSLMKIPGVVGVYRGERADKSPVIRIMAAKKTPELERQIPAQLEGYPVEIEETGVIKPMH